MPQAIEAKKGSFGAYVDLENGTIEREIFSDEAIYQAELERIFARAWNFMCHESQIPKTGDFFQTYIGEESVIVTRDKNGELQVLLNSCRHRGNAVCRAESGNTRSFLCTYHGWTYDLEGKLIGVPGYKEYYKGCLDKAKWGLVKAAKVKSYKGFVFATMDADAPELEEFLGDVGCLALDLFTGQGSLVAVEGVQKNVIGTNWKFAVDNLFDYYHGEISHASAMMSGVVGSSGGGPLTNEEREAILAPMTHRVVLGEYGHAIGGPRLTPDFWKSQAEGTLMKQGVARGVRNEEWRTNPDVLAQIGEVGRDVRGHPSIFPNMWLANNGQIAMRMPKGHDKTEIWWFTFVPEEFTEEQRRARVTGANHAFGPAGLLEQDDGENWDQSTRGTRGVIARRYPLNYQMNVGKGEVMRPAGGPSYIDAALNEHGQLWTWRAWAEWMDAESWSDLMKNHSKAPEAGALL
ncbi:MAG: Rieske 2Fe-2S domain-containing protein [Hyphomonas sp.]|nr:Rieske 2Fe-2S domain-containing protein [Hyphomonas sp.]MCC0017607.1 Rieske 2Fe-2S domain-containing protein [Rhodobiaceae bacterium]